MHGFERFQPTVELVELGVGDDRRVLLVVRKPVLPDLLHEVLVLRTDVPGRDLLPVGALEFRAVPGGCFGCFFSPCCGLCCGLPCAHRPILP